VRKLWRKLRQALRRRWLWVPQMWWHNDAASPFRPPCFCETTHLMLGRWLCVSQFGSLDSKG